MLKVGDFIVMNNKGFAYHGNIDKMFDMYSVAGQVDAKSFEWAFCELMSIQGVGEVLSIDTKMDSVEVKFKNHIKGLYYFNTMFYEQSHISKLSFFQKLKYKLLGRV